MKNSGNNLTVEEFYNTWSEQLSLSLLDTKPDLNNYITEWTIRIPKDLSDLNEGFIHILTNETLSEVLNLSDNDTDILLKNVSFSGIPCFIIENNVEVRSRIIQKIADKVPVFSSGLNIETLAPYAEKVVRDKLTPFITLHGVLIDIHRLGVLILGKSGIGKSESALDLINRGSKLIADDVIEVRKIGTRLVGKGPEKIRHLMEIRGVGIVNIKDLFGSSSVLNEREIDLVIELDQWDQAGNRLTDIYSHGNRSSVHDHTGQSGKKHLNHN